MVLCFAHNLKLLFYYFNCICFHCFLLFLQILYHPFSHCIHFLIILYLFCLYKLFKIFIWLCLRIICFLYSTNLYILCSLHREYDILYFLKISSNLDCILLVFHFKVFQLFDTISIVIINSSDLCWFILFSCNRTIFDFSV